MKKNLLSKPARSQVLQTHAGLVMFFALLFGASNAQIHLVKDINTADSREFDETTLGTDYNGVYFFAVRGKELWQSDGTEINTFKVKDFNSITQMITIDGSLYLIANDGIHGNEIWKSDGTETGTKLLLDIAPGSGGSFPSSFTSCNGFIFFTATDGKRGIEIWKTDGTTTQPVNNLKKSLGISKLKNLISFNNKLYFTANHGSYGFEIWESDGTRDGTHVFKDIVPGKTGSNPELLTVSGSYFYFEAKDANGFELWKSDGTVEGTAMVKDITPGSKNTFFELLFNVDGTLYFSCNDQVHGYELWKSDGTEAGTQLIKDTNPGKKTGFSWVNGLRSFHGKLVYVLGRTFYETDGTIAGTRELFQVGDFYEQKEIVEFNGNLYFVNYAGETSELWKYDGTTVSFVSLISPTSEDYYIGYVHLAKGGAHLFFNSNNSSDNRMRLWKSDGTLAETQEVKDIITGTASSDPNSFSVVGNVAYFKASEVLWRTDGTESGTTKIYDGWFNYVTNIGSTVYFNIWGQLYKNDDGTPSGTNLVTGSMSYSTQIINVNDYIYYSGYSPDTGYELWKTDGTPSGNVLVKDIIPGLGYYYSSDPSNFAEVDGVLYFTIFRSGIGRELWKSDGTTAGTVLVKGLVPGTSNVYNMISSNGLLYFIIYNGSTYQLWVSDGTPTGTTVLKDFPNYYNGSTNMPVDINGTVYFGTSDVANGNALWKTDGTTDGTVKVKDFYTTGYSNVLSFYNGRLYIAVSTETQFELWSSDGTTTGTSKVKTLDIAGGIWTNGSRGGVHNGFLYFNIWSDGQVWRTDGTECGTFRIQYEGDLSNLTFTESSILLSGNYSGVGNELLRLEESEIVAPICSPSARASTVTDEKLKTESTVEKNGLSNYPNPFKTNFTLNVHHPEEQTYKASIIRMDGAVASEYSGLKTNYDYTVGKELTSGIYLVKVIVGGKTETRRIVKIE